MRGKSEKVSKQAKLVRIMHGCIIIAMSVDFAFFLCYFSVSLCVKGNRCKKVCCKDDCNERKMHEKSCCFGGNNNPICTFASARIRYGLGMLIYVGKI